MKVEEIIELFDLLNVPRGKPFTGPNGPKESIKKQKEIFKYLMEVGVEYAGKIQEETPYTSSRGVGKKLSEWSTQGWFQVLTPSWSNRKYFWFNLFKPNLFWDLTRFFGEEKTRRAIVTTFLVHGLLKKKIFSGQRDLPEEEILEEKREMVRTFPKKKILDKIKMEKAFNVLTGENYNRLLSLLSIGLSFHSAYTQGEEEQIKREKERLRGFLHLFEVAFYLEILCQLQKTKKKEDLPQKYRALLEELSFKDIERELKRRKEEVEERFSPGEEEALENGKKDQFRSMFQSLFQPLIKSEDKKEETKKRKEKNKGEMG